MIKYPTEQEYNSLWTVNDELHAEIDRLRKAIETHRNNLWRDGFIDHDEDRELYKALEVEK